MSVLPHDDLSRDRDAMAPELEVISRWHVEPTEWALNESEWHQDKQLDPYEGLPRSFCPEVGRRMLLSQLEFSSWVLRRVEKVQFERDRSVSRQIAIDLKVRADAPVFRDENDHDYWLVPLSSMRRRTLVNLDLRTENGESLTMPGIRLTQQLDQAMLLAAAATTELSAEHAQRLRDFVLEFVAGDFRAVMRAWSEFSSDTPPAHLLALRHNHAFQAAMSLLHRNFTLYAFLPVSAGRQRLIRMSFEEPTDWLYRRPSLTRDGSSWDYDTGKDPVPWWERTQFLASFAQRPTRIRLQTPGADKAASYHFEIVAPHGLRIVRATLLAGRPNDGGRKVSEDHVLGHSPTVGLHALEVPSSSLCRVQVDLRVPSRGWLTAMMISCVVVFGVLLSVLVHLLWRHPTLKNNDVRNNVVLILITTSAGVATLIAAPEFGGLAGRMVGRLGAIGAVSTSLPIVAAAFLAYLTYPPDNLQLQIVRVAAFALTGLECCLLALVTMAWLRSQRGSRRSQIEESPWDMTVDHDPEREPIHDFAAGVRKYHFDTPAVGIRSAEGWHERYCWDDDKQQEATDRLRALGAPVEAHYAACRLVSAALPGCAAAASRRP